MDGKFYLDAEKKKMNPDLIDKEALEIAKSFFGNGYRNNLVYVSSHQLRRFYNEVKDLEKRLEKQDWKTLEPMVRMLKPKVAYATAPSKVNRDEKEVYRNFKNFITEKINLIQDKADFKAFCLMFEAVVGYYYGEGGK